MKEQADYQKIVDDINAKIPYISLWDGYWIHKFKNQNLAISGSQDRLLYRDIDLVFKKVIFFNLPSDWSDTQVTTNQMLRLSDPEEFSQHQPDFDTKGLPVFAIDLLGRGAQRTEKHTFFVIAEAVFLFKCLPPDDKPGLHYKDPLGKVPYTCKENRVI